MSDVALLMSISHKFDFVVRDPVWGDIHLDLPLHDLFRSPQFYVLDGIRQLGPVSFVYPGATHTRKAHSLGVYYLARRLALSLLERGQIPYATPEGLRSFLVAALCHDLGHFPFAHSLKDLPLAPHESLGSDLIAREPLRSAVMECGADPEQVAAIIDGDRAVPTDRETLLYRNFLSGVLDPDKIDYLTRDAYYCGVPYGIQDADFIVRRVLVENGTLAVDQRGEMSVEEILFSKYQMYRSVYWHPAVRSATSMVKKSILAALDLGVLGPEQLYGLDDAEFKRLVLTFDAQAFDTARLAFSGRFYSPVAEIPYNAQNATHRDLDDLYRRSEAESALATAAGMSDADIVVDIPEPISFETNLLVKRGNSVEDFDRKSPFFGPESLDRIRGSLRKIRIFANPDTMGKSLRELAVELLS